MMKVNGQFHTVTTATANDTHFKVRCQLYNVTTLIPMRSS
jgi:hypothetical protein